MKTLDDIFLPEHTNTDYCNECCDWVELTDYVERKCSLCNPQWMDDDDMQPLDFNDD